MNEIPNKRIKDLTGMESGLLKVIEFSHVDENSKSAMWLCQCECGNRKLISSRCLLRKDNTQSCGCLQKQKARENMKKTSQNNRGKIKGNKYVFCDDAVIGYETRYNHEFYIDKDDYPKICKYTWYEDNNGYISTFGENRTDKILLHRLIMDCSKGDGVIIDHINGERRNCVKSNLRKADYLINAWNSVGYGKSGAKGVRFRKGKYEARIVYKGKEIYIGRFNTLNEAANARESFEQRFYPEYRRAT